MTASVTVQDVYDYVSRKILNKELFPGNRITEEDLAGEMQTSRTTVRSAITKLSYDGFIELVPKKGACVARSTIEDLPRMYGVRRILEEEAVRWAVPRISEEALERMELCIQEQIDLEKNYRVSRYVDINRRFHWEIIKAANNEYLEKYLSELFNKTAIYLIFFDHSTTNSDSIFTHRKILEALRARDVEAAAAAIREDSTLAKRSIDFEM